MPEIPDLNIFSRNVAKQLLGKTLLEMHILITRRLKLPEADFKEALEGQQLIAIDRIGKELHFRFQNGHVLGLQLMLYGSMYWYENKNDHKFTIAEMLFDSGTGLAITDWQKAVILTLDPKPHPAPDAMSMPPEYLLTALKNQHKPIKTVLATGKIVQGIGNAYADEILYAAGISPFSIASKIPEAHVTILVKAITTVLTDAESHILKNFPDTITEKERDFLQVHRPKQTFTLNGEPILKAELDKRKTYYTAEQQFFE